MSEDIYNSTTLLPWQHSS